MVVFEDRKGPPQCQYGAAALIESADLLVAMISGKCSLCQLPSLLRGSEVSNFFGQFWTSRSRCGRFAPESSSKWNVY